MSDSVTHTPAAQGTQGDPVAVAATGADLIASATPAATPPAADPAATGDLIGLKPADPATVSRDATVVADPKKNADGTDKTPEQIAAEDRAAADAARAQAVPEKYELKVGEADADPAAVEAFTPIAKELGLTNDQAQKLVNFHAEQVTAAQAKLVETQASAWKTLGETWQANARADKEFGHLAGGRTFEANLGLVSKGIDAFGTPALRQALVDSGMSNHPEVVRAFYRIGLAVSEDKIRVGNAGNSGAPPSMDTLARSMYPSMKQ